MKLDEISANTLKIVCNAIKSPLTSIINNIFNNSVYPYPSDLKVCKSDTNS